jgi:hypothetical protein
MSWYVCLDDKGNIFPILKDDAIVKIPYTDSNKTFTLENNVIYQTSPLVTDGTITWTKTVYCNVKGMQKMICFPDVERLMQERRDMLGKTVTYKDKVFKISQLKRENHVSTHFDVEHNHLHTELMINDDGMFIGDEGEWKKL